MLSLHLRRVTAFLLLQALSANVSSCQWLTEVCRGSAKDSAVRKCILLDLNIRGLIFVKEKAMFEELNKIPHADGAGYDSRRQSAPVRCLEHTRTEVLERIWHWIAPPTQTAATESTSDAVVKPTLDTSSDTAVKPIYWVNGLAGIGKSTIARTIAEDAKDRNLLGASFFFSRQEKELSDAKFFIPTIAHQLAQSYPELRPAIIKV